MIKFERHKDTKESIGIGLKKDALKVIRISELITVPSGTPTYREMYITELVELMDFWNTEHYSKWGPITPNNVYVEYYTNIIDPVMERYITRKAILSHILNKFILYEDQYYHIPDIMALIIKELYPT